MSEEEVVLPEIKGRRERWPDGSVKIEITQVHPKIQTCRSCEWCKRVQPDNMTKDVIGVNFCHFFTPPKICGVEKLEGECTNTFVPMIPEAKKHHSPFPDPSGLWIWNDCKHYLPYGSHYNTDEKWVLE